MIKFFYEVLVKGRVSLFEKDKCNLLAAGNPAGYRGTSLRVEIRLQGLNNNLS
jgi:hypothetical protein